MIIAAFRAELFSTAVSLVFIGAGDRDLPLGICFYVDASESYYGDRVCNNGLAGAIISVLVTIPLMLIDLLLPFTNSTVCSNTIFQAMYMITHAHTHTYACTRTRTHIHIHKHTHKL